MDTEELISQLNDPGQCKKYGIPLWQCPQFLFIVMGLVIVFSSVSAYAVGTRYIDNPSIVALIVLCLTAVLFIISFVITQSFNKLAEASRMKSEFINIVSHQLRSPLTNLKWGTEILMSEKLVDDREKYNEYLGILKENSDRMEELVNDLLIVSRLEEGKLALKKEEVSLQELTSKAISDFEAFIKASNIEIAFKFSEKVPLIQTDVRQIKIVLENLLDNSVRYIKKNGKIDIFLDLKGNNIYFEIKDNGAGIPEEDQKYIFQKFFRSKNALRHQTQGTGLGLFITKAIIKRLRGEIGFKSKENQETVFWFTLPIK